MYGDSFTNGRRHPPVPANQSSLPTSRTERKAFCGISTWPNCTIRFFPSFCFWSSFRCDVFPDWVREYREILGLKGNPDEKQKIWPIVQLANWGEPVSVEQVVQVVDFGTRRPATGVMAFHWNGLSQQWDKVEALGPTYRAMQPTDP